MTSELSVTYRLRRHPSEISRARERARKALTDWGLADHTGLRDLIGLKAVVHFTTFQKDAQRLLAATPGRQMFLGVVDVRGGHQDGQQQVHAVHDGMAVPAVDVLRRTPL